jgi:predicted cobalt transporter CbtA
MGRLLLRGMLAGLLAAVVAFVFARLLGEPAVQAAIDLETARDRAAGLLVGPDLVSRGVQGTVGLLTGLALYGVSLGGLFAIGFALLQGRVAGLGARGLALGIALAGWVTVGLAPALKYPANPPAVGDPQSIGRRSGLYFTLVVVCVLLAVASGLLARRVAPGVGGWNAGLLGLGFFLAGYVVAAQLMPGIDEVPDGFPAGVLWQFRMSSLGTVAILWVVLGLVFGALTERAARQAAPHPAEPARTP